ncbi:unnamed protein product [Allacma fusca]|uniref:C2 domain-containing protein n=1 Tax=Allacma fusca TaxID=39272 RepID=A0A8J2IYN1_9HEXA|nr:unnamed protein product [Allacma fusca]
MKILLFLLGVTITACFVESYVTPYKIEFLLSASKLPAKNPYKNNKTIQPYARVWHSYSRRSRRFEPLGFAEVGRTQFLTNNTDPAWGELFQITLNTTNFRYYDQQKIRVEVYDHDPKKSDDFIGTVEFLLDDLIHSFGIQLKLFLDHNYLTTPSMIIVKGREYGLEDAYVDPRFFHPTETIVFPTLRNKGK